MRAEDGEFRPLDSHRLANAGYSTPICSIDCLSISPPLLPNGLLSKFLHLCLPGPSERELLFCSIITRQRRGTRHWPGPPLMEPGLAAREWRWTVRREGGGRIGRWIAEMRRWGREGAIAGLSERWEDVRIDKRVDVVWENGPKYESWWWDERVGGRMRTKEEKMEHYISRNYCQ